MLLTDAPSSTSTFGRISVLGQNDGEARFVTVCGFSWKGHDRVALREDPREDLVLILTETTMGSLIVLTRITNTAVRLMLYVVCVAILHSQVD